MRIVLVLFLIAAHIFLATKPFYADEVSDKYRAVVAKGLDWLARKQFRDGHWEMADGGGHSAMTGLAGMALLMEGSTLRDGKYQVNIRRAVDYLMSRSDPHTGLIGDKRGKNMEGYMYGHGYSLLFLSQLVGEEENVQRRHQLEEIITRAVDFTCKAQTFRGGWGYLSARDLEIFISKDFDEGSTTVVQIQALRAARNAGISVPKEVIDKTQEYLRQCTTEEGGLIYSLAQPDLTMGSRSRPTITAAGIAVMFNTGEYKSPLAKRWLKFVQSQIPLNKIGKAAMGHSEYTHLYYSQVAYTLGEDGYAKLFPDSKPENRLTWSKYREGIFPVLADSQKPDGSWTGCGIGTVFTTACYLTVLQLDKGTLPIYQR